MLNRIVAALAVIATAALVAVPAAPALARTADTPSCAARTTCMFGDTSYGTPEQDYYNPGNHSTWINLPINERASVIEGGNSDVWFWNEGGGFYTCVQAGSQNPGLIVGAAGGPGWMYIDYGVQGCQEPFPADAPGA